MRRMFFVVFQSLAVSLLASGMTSAEPSPGGHELAQKFATESQAKDEPAAPKVQHEYEKELIDAARAEAKARHRAAQAQPNSMVVETAPAPPKPAATERPTPPAAEPAPATETVVPSPGQRMKIKIEAKIAKPAPAGAPTGPATAAGDGRQKAAVLIVLTDHAGERRAASDPIICVGDTCYLSSGLEKAAKRVAKADALSTRNAITNGAAACKGRQRCAFRGVTLDPGSELQIVDLGIVRHDRREAVEAKIDGTCTINQGDLVCDNPRTAPDHRIWLVPEAVAAAAGPAAIEAALADDLPEEDIARETDK